MSSALESIKLDVTVTGLGHMGERRASTFLSRAPRTHVAAVRSADAREVAWAQET